VFWRDMLVPTSAIQRLTCDQKTDE